MKSKSLSALIGIAALLCLCITPAQAKTLKYIGSSTVGKFMHEAAKVYKAVDFSINTKPESGGGENATAAGKCDIGGVAREVKPKILAKGVKKFLIGKDAIGVWVNVDNPVSSLDKKQLKEIFTGKITNWKEVGGPDMPINVYIVNKQSATRKVFQKTILEGAPYAGKRLKTVRPDSAILDKVAADKAGIGQLSFAFGSGHPAAAKVKKINIGQQAATVNNPNYPITRPLYLITKGDPKGEVKAFIDWAQSDAGQKIVKKYFVGK
ncbi:MAG: phosphate ABC transporter substrate-binding protein [Deltaproteobacteria bacterium]|nr:phosphate ABC transporter substrate-binding protein [Deltaproteobacteria bacterium]